MIATLESIFYAYVYGEWESLTRWAWLYLHTSILFATALVGFTFAHGAYGLTALLVPFPLVYLYKRYEKAKTAAVRTDPSA